MWLSKWIQRRVLDVIWTVMTHMDTDEVNKWTTKVEEAAEEAHQKHCQHQGCDMCEELISLGSAELPIKEVRRIEDEWVNRGIIN